MKYTTQEKITDSHFWCFRVFEEYPQKSQIWKSETNPSQGTWLGISWLGLVSLCQIWDFYGYSLNTLKYPKMGIRYLFLCNSLTNCQKFFVYKCLFSCTAIASICAYVKCIVSYCCSREARLPSSWKPSQPALSYEHIKNFAKDLEVRQDLVNRASPVNRAHMRRP